MRWDVPPCVGTVCTLWTGCWQARISHACPTTQSSSIRLSPFCTCAKIAQEIEKCLENLRYEATLHLNRALNGCTGFDGMVFDGAAGPAVIKVTGICEQRAILKIINTRKLNELTKLHWAYD